MKESDFKKILNIPDIKEEYEQIKAINQEYFMIIKECFIKIRVLEKYLNKEIIKGLIMLKIDNIARILGNNFCEESNAEYKKIFFELNSDILNIFEIFKTMKNSKQNINYEDLDELKNYYLSMRFLIYYYKLLMHNYNIKVNELINFENGITVIISELDKKEEIKTKEKIKNYYEVKNGKNKKSKNRL